MTQGISPLTAATHPDPYPYYAELRARRLFRDDGAALWIAADADSIEAVLGHPAARVRPPAMPVPEPIQGAPAGEVFGRLVRMNDGEYQQRVKAIVATVLKGLRPEDVMQRATSQAEHVAAKLGVTEEPEAIREFCYGLPVQVVGALLGLPDARLEEAANLTADFVRCIAPGGSEAQIASANVAARELHAACLTALRSGQHAERSGLLFDLKRAAESDAGVDEASVIANAVGFLSQTFEATAGLIGNTLVTLARRPQVLSELRASPSLLPRIVREVMRFDPSIQNTRRFLAEDIVVAGHTLRAGEAVLLLLASANRDPSRNPQADTFDVRREAPYMLGFGRGAHECPGQALAEAIAVAAVQVLLARGFEPTAMVTPVAYRPSANARIPELTLNPQALR